ncbi:KRAB-A domain-containing protein 2-like [Thrips palmi]|uniref:KRAB-A domain-containing protein 2-like n=1 Tax=Thrips palmi TaxID=161013 RepID=A0A6P8YZ81_THRPL|nr:KRAB-A domain-containing protein 2-like [Thrips palmi]
MAMALQADDSDFPDKTKFYERLEEALSTRRLENSNYIRAEQYEKFIRETKEAKNNRSLSLSKRRLQRFAVCEVDGVEHLIVPLKPGETNMKFFVKVEDLYDRIKTHHTATHKGRNRIVASCNLKYKNITQEAITIFLQLCPGCLGKKKMKLRGLTVKPMVFNKFNDRCQIDLIDLQSALVECQPGDEQEVATDSYKWILVVQDHLTKYVHLRPLKSKKAVEVAHHVVEIFLDFGAPAILQSDNGRAGAPKSRKISTTWWATSTAFLDFRGRR